MEGESKEKWAEVGYMDIEKLGCEKLEVSVFGVSMVEKKWYTFQSMYNSIILYDFSKLWYQLWEILWAKAPLNYLMTGLQVWI